MPITTLEAVKERLQITDSLQDDLILARIIDAENDYLRIRIKPFVVNEEGETVYPLGSEKTAISMVEYLLNKETHEDIQSKTVSDVSVTYKDTSQYMHGYPEKIVSEITQYGEFF